MRWPRREPVREYGRGGCGVRAVPALGVPFGAGLDVKRGADAPRTLCENPRAGVGARVGCLRKGDSGRGNDGPRLGLKDGLGGLAPGPIDWENFGGSAGVGGV